MHRGNQHHTRKADTMEDCKGCGNPSDYCVCDELDHYGEDVERVNTPTIAGWFGDYHNWGD
jgi:hypothetical protein